jgi:hypothetical protein
VSENSGFAVLRIEGEGLVCAVTLLVRILHSLNGTLGRLGGYSAHKLRVQDVLVPLRPGYEIMAYARKE